MPTSNRLKINTAASWFLFWITAKGRRREEEIFLVLKFEGLDLPPASLEAAESAEKDFLIVSALSACSAVKIILCWRI
jgi:hypothetical protein